MFAFFHSEYFKLAPDLGGRSNYTECFHRDQRSQELSQDELFQYWPKSTINLVESIAQLYLRKRLCNLGEKNMNKQEYADWFCLSPRFW